MGAKKSLGQHWLVDEDALQTIVDTAAINADNTVLEIGPGRGVLTHPLAKSGAKVVAVEADADLIPGLLAQFAGKPNVEILQQDIRKFDTQQLPSGYKVVANIPYYLTSYIVQFFLESANKPIELVLLIQKEVAERICAKPGQMSVLAVSVQYYAEPTYIATVPSAAFRPAPKVDSAIIQIKLRPKPLFEADTKQLFRLVKAGFGEKRKMLRNSLAGGLQIDSAQTIELIAKAGLPETARAQELSLQQWQELYKVVQEMQLI